ARAMADGLYRRLPGEVRSLVSPSGDIALRSPSHPIVRDVLRLLPAPLVIAMVATPLHPVPTTPESLRGLAGVDMVIDAGPTQYQQFATVVRIDDESWSIERAGVVDEMTLMQTSSLIILFGCTGNTCRSPMAEAISQGLLASRLRCEVAELEGRGFVIRSAGVAATNGVPAAAHAIDVIRALGGSLEHHRSRKIAGNLVRQADCIFAMTGDHLDALLDAFPEV